MDRRQFMKHAGALGVAVSIGYINQKEAHAAKSFKARFRNPVKVSNGWDVIVVGGGPSGCAAAAAAAREGAHVLVIESTGALGGMGTSGLLNCWCPFTDGEKIIYRGIAEKVFLESKKGVPDVKGNNWVPINTEYLKRVYDKLMACYHVHVLFFSSVADVEMKGDGTVEAVVVANKAGLTAFQSKVFIDCTGDGDIAAWSGAQFNFGDSNNAVQSGSLCFSIANINHDAYMKIGTVQSGNKRSPIHQMLASGEYDLITDGHINDKYPGHGYLMFNAGHVPVDSTDPESLSAAVVRGRKTAEQFKDGLAKYCPEVFADSYLAATGSLMGIRESRRIRCDYTFSIEDWLERREFEDNIGRNCYYIDVHNVDAVKYPRYSRGESHGIPLRCLLPVGLKNVIVAGRCISTDHATQGSLRVMPPAMVTGEAAGVAAGLICHSCNIDIHSVTVSDVQKRLRQEGQLL